MKPKRLVLSDAESAALKKFLSNARDSGEYRRGVALMLKAEGYSFKDISSRLGVGHRSVCRWVKGYKLRGLDSLRTKPRAGRRPRLSGEERRLIVETALKDPKLFGYLRNDWSIRLLSEHLTRRLGIKVSKSHVWRMLREAGIVYKRPKAVVRSPDPDYEDKARKVEGYKKAASALEKRG